MVEIRKVSQNKNLYKEMLLDADPDWSMVEKYLSGDMYVAFVDGTAAAEAIVYIEEGKMPEIKNIATAPEFRRQGLGQLLLRHIFDVYRKGHNSICVGTCSVSKAALSFYARSGFTYSHTVKGFFTDNYPEPIYEDGLLCEDMVYLVAKLH